MNNLIKRSITGISFIVIVAGAVLLGHFSYYVLFLIIMIISLLEYIELVKNIKTSVIQNTDNNENHRMEIPLNLNKDKSFSKQIKITKIPILISGVIVFTLTFLEAQKFINASWLSLLILPVFLFPLFTFIKQGNNKLLEICLTVFGLIYIIMPISLSNYLVFSPNGSSHTYSPDLLILTFILIWTHDTFAYITGRYTGNHKLAKQISPAKTWEGTVGGTVMSILVASLIGYFSNKYPMFHFIILPIVVSSAATLGDLIESSLKRAAKVKDSGNILPGHGGILDRFDAAFLAIPAVFVYIQCFLI